MHTHRERERERERPKVFIVSPKTARKGEAEPSSIYSLLVQHPVDSRTLRLKGDKLQLVKWLREQTIRKEKVAQK